MLKFIRRLNEGTESDLGAAKENQTTIRTEIANMQTEMAEVEKSNKSYLDKTTQKTKLMKDIATRMIDLARSIELEADLMLKAAKENPNPEQESPTAPATPETPEQK